MSNERRHIERYEGYLFSADGTAWSCWETFWEPGKVGVQHEMTDKWIRLASNLRGGYLRVTIRDKETGKRNSVLIHQAILEAFFGPRPLGLQACHNNGDRFDNRACNLRWDTAAANNRDRAAHGVLPRGERTGNTPLTEVDVRMIRALRGQGRSYGSIAPLFNVTKRTIINICVGRTWKHVI